MTTGCAVQDTFEISPRFRRTVEERIPALKKTPTSMRRSWRASMTSTTSAARCAWWPQSALRRCA